MISRSALVAVAVCLAACSAPAATTTASPVVSPASPGAAAAPSAPAPRAVQAPSGQRYSATATLHDVAGGRVGVVTLTDSYSGVLVSGSLTGVGLGAHGIHVHEIGKCEAPFTSAGGHFNPEHRKHGFMSPEGSHLGDMPNIDTPAAGQLKFEFILPNVTLAGKNALLDSDGASIVIHAGRDDYRTDPSGNSGGRIACGVIVSGG